MPGCGRARSQDGGASGIDYPLRRNLDLWDVWWNKRNFVQPEVLWTKRITDKIGPFREDLFWVMDYEYGFVFFAQQVR